jgi:hypothetical protein
MNKKKANNHLIFNWIFIYTISKPTPIYKTSFILNKDVKDVYSNKV